MRLAVCMHKGGDGKTTLSVHLAAASALKGAPTLLVDLDQVSYAALWLDAEPPAALLDVLAEGRDVKEAVCPVASVRGLSVLVAGRRFGRLAELMGEKGDYLLVEVLGGLFEEYEHVVFDCPPVLGPVVRNVLTAATHILIPITCSYLSAAGLDSLVGEIVEVARRTNPAIRFLGVVINAYEEREKHQREIAEWLRELFRSYGLPVFETVVHKSVDFRKAVLRKLPVQLMAPKGRAAREVERLWDEVLERAK